ncbi:MAG: hypothetical protein H6625_04545 [Bdellovibrionaceae bacterium]|nr:hypothetical protein [Pseudobdellovibrionaceae bacterium]
MIIMKELLLNRICFYYLIFFVVSSTVNISFAARSDCDLVFIIPNEESSKSIIIKAKASNDIFEKNEINIDGIRYESFQRVSIADKKAVEELKIAVFLNQFYVLAYKALSIEAIGQYRLILSSDGLALKLVREDYQTTLVFGKRKNRKKEAQLESLRKIAFVIKAFLVDSYVGYPNVLLQNERLLVKLDGSQIRDPKMSEPINMSDFFTSLDRNGVTTDLYPQLRELISKIPLGEIKKLLLSLDLPLYLVDRIAQRQNQVLEALDYENEIYLGDSIKTVLRSREYFNKSRQRMELEPIEWIRKRVRSRFEADFVRNTNFKSFEEYKVYVMQFPEYRKLIEDFQKHALLRIDRHQVRRSSIVLEGFKTLFQTGTSSVSNANEYVSQRISVEAQGFGMSNDEFINILPVNLHPKSAFLVHLENDRNGEIHYGSDHYYISLEKILKDPQAPVITFTLGDSKDESYRWYSRPVLAEDFYYFAAPFIHDARTRLRDKGFMSINYRTNDYFGHFRAVLPNFLGNLEERFNIFLRSEFDVREPSENPTVYTEAQIYGFLGIGHVQHIAFEKEAVLSKQLEDVYHQLGVEVIRY